MEENKEKQIKELTKDIGIAFQLAGTARFGPVAEILADKWQRKIPENSVIVSKQVWEEHIENWDKTTRAVEERVRKETAEKYKVAMMLCIQEMQKYLEVTEEQAKILYYHNNEVAKQFYAEIKEN